jgi:hypothetical protein
VWFDNRHEDANQLLTLSRIRSSIKPIRGQEIDVEKTIADLPLRTPIFTLLPKRNRGRVQRAEHQSTALPEHIHG